MNHEFSFDSMHPHLELSQGELESLHDTMASRVILGGDVSELGGIYPVRPEAPQPHIFEKPIDAGVAKSIFHTHDSELIGQTGCYAQYLEPHLVNPYGTQAIEATHSIVSVSLCWRLAGSDIEQIETYMVQSEQGMFRGTVSTDYSRNGERISPNNWAPSDFVTQDDVLDLIEDLHALDRPLSLEDAEKLRRLIDTFDESDAR